jgi:hypothetical protein
VSNDGTWVPGLLQEHRAHAGGADKEVGCCFFKKGQVGYLPPDYDHFTNHGGLNVKHHDHASGHLLLLTSIGENKKLQDPEVCARLVQFWHEIGVPFVPSAKWW